MGIARDEMDVPYFTGSVLWRSNEIKLPIVVGHPKILSVHAVRCYDMREDPDYMKVTLGFKCDPSLEKEIPYRIDEIISILQEWKSMLVEPNLTGNEPRISKNWRLPHEQDETKEQ